MLFYFERDRNMLWAVLILSNEKFGTYSTNPNERYTRQLEILRHHKCINKKSQKWTKAFSESKRSQFENSCDVLIRFLEPEIWERIRKSKAVAVHAEEYNSPIITQKHDTAIGLCGWIRWTECRFEHDDEELLMDLAA